MERARKMSYDEAIEYVKSTWNLMLNKINRKVNEVHISMNYHNNIGVVVVLDNGKCVSKWYNMNSYLLVESLNHNLIEDLGLDDVVVVLTDKPIMKNFNIDDELSECLINFEEEYGGEGYGGKKGLWIVNKD